ncbi:MAG: polyphosphate kinase 1 [Phycisphaerae bacterium]|nr:polyphosphate kinase 1 [Phycisphaerae bacterium]
MGGAGGAAPNGHAPLTSHAPAGVPPNPARAAGAPTRPDVTEHARTFNRDLSWLEFNRRVLHQAIDERTPLLERVRFLAIFTSNLDEFVMKRVGYLKRRLSAGREEEMPEAIHTGLLLGTIRHTFENMEHDQADCFVRSIRPALALAGIHLLEYRELDAAERARLEAWYRRNVFPVLTPLAVDPGHRFPFISNLSQNLGVILSEPGKEEALFARVKVPQGMPQWVRIPPASPTDSEASDRGRGRFVALSDLIASNLDDLFPGMKILEVMPFRVTRSAAVDENTEDADNLLDFVEAQLKRRRFASVVRLEVAPGASPRLRTHVMEMLGLGPSDLDEIQGQVDYRSLFEIADLPRPDLRDAPWHAVVPARLADTESDIFSIIRRGDVLVHHPYESFPASAERFIAEAAADPAVLAIKQTIYRTSRDSPFIGHLIRAAESGKQVACLVEVRARFDEGRNVRFAQMLEKAGVHVAYGVVGLKTHCKAALVVRRESDGLRGYAHLGTGNYNPSTARLYTDVGLFTCDPDLTADVVDLFNFLTGRSRQTDYRRLLVAPATMKDSFERLIHREATFARAHAAGLAPVGGRIVAKMNALQDPAITQRLYQASQAGVKIELYVRGFCCLRPGVPGLSDTITVTSVVGRFLEHSRLFHFGAGKSDPLDGDWYFGSADWMYRNLEQRVEAVCPVADRTARAALLRIIDVMRRDHRCAWDLRPDGGYRLRPTPADADPLSPEALGTFQTLMREAAAGAAANST